MFAKIIIGIVTFAMLCAMVWFGAPRTIVPMWNHAMDGEMALRELPTLQAQIKADHDTYNALAASNASAAQAAVARCDQRVKSAQSFASTLAKYGAPAKSVNGSRPFLGVNALDRITP